MPEGRRPEGTALPEGIFLPRTKKTEVEAAISLYIARRDPIYIINVPPFFFSHGITLIKIFYIPYWDNITYNRSTSLSISSQSGSTPRYSTLFSSLTDLPLETDIKIINIVYPLMSQNYYHIGTSVVRHFLKHFVPGSIPDDSSSLLG